MHRAIFLDRDGVINEKAPEGEYITSWEAFSFLPGVVEAIAAIHQAGFLAVVVTNQRCVAKRLMTIAELESMHERMSSFLAARGAGIDAVYYCPHELQSACRCRKPAIGMFLDAARDRAVDLDASWMIGDSEFDMEAGRNAGCKTALVAAAPMRTATLERQPKCAVNVVADSLLDAVRQILDHEKQSLGPENVPLGDSTDAAGASR